MVLSQRRTNCKLFSFCLTPWVYASLWRRIKINYLCTKAALVYNLLFKKGAYMSSFICRNGVTNKSWLTPSTVAARCNCSAHTVLSLRCRTCEKLEESSEITLPDLRITPERSSCPAPHLLLVQNGCKPNNNKHVTCFPNNKLPFMKPGRYVIHSKVSSTPCSPTYINNVHILGHKYCTMWQI